jgi:hypothetical protein
MGAPAVPAAAAGAAPRRKRIAVTGRSFMFVAYPS